MALFIFTTSENFREKTDISQIHPSLTKHLDELTTGEEGFIFILNLDSPAVKELEEVGVRRNALVESICRNDSAIIIRVDNRRVALDCETASNILVHPVK